MGLTSIAIPDFIVSICTLSLGAFVFITNPKEKRNWLFFLLTIASFVWLFAYGIVSVLGIGPNSLLLAKIGHAGATMVTPILFCFTLEVLGTYKKKFDRLLFKISFLAALVASYLAFSSPLYFKGLEKHSWGTYPLGGPLMLTYTFFTFAIAMRALFLYLAASKQAKKELKIQEYQKFKYFSISLSIFILAASDYLPKFGWGIYPFGYIFVGIFSSLITYAIVRHKILDVDVILRRSFIYSLLIFFLTAIYLSVILISEFIFRTYLGYKSVLIAILASSVIAASFNPLRLYIQKVIDKHFYKFDPEKIIAENSQMKAAIEKQDRLKAVATLAAGMAHEIRNPLTSIKTFAEYLPEKYDDPEFRLKFSRIVSDEVERVNNIVKQLLEFSKPEDLNLRPSSIVSILNETLSLLSNNLLRQKIEVIKKYASDPILNADKNQLKQAFLNLFLNSIQAMPNGGKLAVSVGARDADKIIISISDTGPGIPAENLKNIFDPFFTTKESGTGLGLSIVHGIIEKHGGKITVENLNQGALFKIKLPAEKQ